MNLFFLELDEADDYNTEGTLIELNGHERRAIKAHYLPRKLKPDRMFLSSSHSLFETKYGSTCKLYYSGKTISCSRA